MAWAEAAGPAAAEAAADPLVAAAVAAAESAVLSEAVAEGVHQGQVHLGADSAGHPERLADDPRLAADSRADLWAA